jgi:hypothetical protein
VPLSALLSLPYQLNIIRNIAVLGQLIPIPDLEVVTLPEIVLIFIILTLELD